jgi:hypothetical protein
LAISELSTKHVTRLHFNLCRHVPENPATFSLADFSLPLSGPLVRQLDRTSHDNGQFTIAGHWPVSFERHKASAEEAEDVDGTGLTLIVFIRPA